MVGDLLQLNFCTVSNSISALLSTSILQLLATKLLHLLNSVHTLYTVHTIVTVICIIQSCTLYSVQYTTQSIRGLLYLLRLLTLIHAAVALNGANTTLHLNYAACAPNLNQNLQMPLQQNMQFPSIFVNYINNLLN